MSKKKQITDKRNDVVKKSNVTVKKSLVSFNFMYLTDNKEHNFDFFRKDMRERHDAYQELCKRLKELSCNNMDFWKKAGKLRGCEPIPYESFSDTFKSILSQIEIVSTDSQLAVFRFSNSDYRIIGKAGIFEENTIYIIGFDFNHSAYNHGS